MAADAGPPTEMVTIILGSDYADVPVFSSEVDGRLIDSSRTSMDGKASLLARDGGMVSFSLFPGGLTTFLDVNSAEDLWWPLDSQALPGGQTLRVNAPEAIGGEYYQIFACRDRRFEFDAPLAVDMQIDDDCLSNANFPVMGFVSDYNDLVAYGQATVDSQGGLLDPVDLVWSGDFEEIPVQFAYPGLTPIVRASPALQYGPSFVQVPPHQVDLDEPVFKRPPGDAQQLWTELRAYGPERGWQVHQGPLPLAKSDWMRVPAGAVISHSATASPTLRWLPTEEGDLVSGWYLWDSEQGFGLWEFVGIPKERYAAFPELPEALASAMPLGVEPSFGDFYLSVIDHKDLEGYEAVMAAGRMPWSSYSVLAEDFLREGGAMASATTVAFIP